MGSPLYAYSKATVTAMKTLWLALSKAGQGRLVYRKSHGTVFFRDTDGNLLVDFLWKGHKVDGQYYVTSLWQLQDHINAKHQGKLTEGKLFHQDIAPAHMSVVSWHWFTTLAWNLLITYHILQIWHYQTCICSQTCRGTGWNTSYHRWCHNGCCRGILKHARQGLLPGRQWCWEKCVEWRLEGWLRWKITGEKFSVTHPSHGSQEH